MKLSATIPMLRAALELRFLYEFDSPAVSCEDLFRDESHASTSAGALRVARMLAERIGGECIHVKGAILVLERSKYDIDLVEHVVDDAHASGILACTLDHDLLIAPYSAITLCAKHNRTHRGSDLRRSFSSKRIARRAA